MSQQDTDETGKQRGFDFLEEKKTQKDSKLKSQSDKYVLHLSDEKVARACLNTFISLARNNNNVFSST